MSNTVLTNTLTYDPVASMIFGKASKETVPNENPKAPPIKYHRINISTRNPDGSIGDLILDCGRVFSFGVSENLAQDGHSINGYSLPLCLLDRENPTQEQKTWLKNFNAMCENVVDYLLKDDVKESIEKYDLVRPLLSKINPIYVKRERGKVVEGAPPVLYAKLMTQRKKLKKGEADDGSAPLTIKTKFYDEDTQEERDPLTFLGKYCYVTPALKVESIYIGNSISLQLKLYETDVKQLGAEQKRLRPSRSVPESSSSVVDALMGVSQPVITGPAAPVTTGPVVTGSASKKPLRVVEAASSSEDEEEEDETPKPAKRVIPGKKK